MSRASTLWRRMLKGSLNSSHTELSVPKIASAKASGEDTSTQRIRPAVRFDRARLAQSSMLAASDLDEKACHVAFFSRRWEAGRGRLLLGGCAVATPFALLLMYPGDVAPREGSHDRAGSGSKAADAVLN